MLRNLFRNQTVHGNKNLIYVSMPLRLAVMREVICCFLVIPVKWLSRSQSSHSLNVCQRLEEQEKLVTAEGLYRRALALDASNAEAQEALRKITQTIQVSQRLGAEIATCWPLPETAFPFLSDLCGSCCWCNTDEMFWFSLCCWDSDHQPLHIFVLPSSSNLPCGGLENHPVRWQRPLRALLTAVPRCSKHGNVNMVYVWLGNNSCVFRCLSV